MIVMLNKRLSWNTDLRCSTKCSGSVLLGNAFLAQSKVCEYDMPLDKGGHRDVFR